jgi:hypothetical protein
MSAPERFIALEIRASRFGFAVLERPDRLLDWGVRTFGEQVRDLESTVSDRINTLLEFYDPVAVVIRKRKDNALVRADRSRAILGAIRRETKRTSVAVHVLTSRRVRDHLASSGQMTKHDIAKSLAERFEELSFKLPNRRKAYQSEAPAMLVFDALATGIAFLDIS